MSGEAGAGTYRHWLRILQSGWSVISVGPRLNGSSLIGVGRSRSKDFSPSMMRDWPQRQAQVRWSCPTMGGRQLDGVPPTIDLVANMVDAVGDRMEVILDGGIRRGAHIAKALAMGARACMTGRPYLYGLAAHGRSEEHTSELQSLMSSS